MGARKKYLVGRYLKGAIEQDVQGFQIGSNQAFGVEMTDLQESQELTLLTTETMDMVGDITSRFPLVGGVMNFVAQGWHNLVFGASPSGFKKGGVDHRLDFYGSSMVGLMSKEMYLFYTGQYYSSLDEEARGIMPFNAFQDRVVPER